MPAFRNQFVEGLNAARIEVTANSFRGAAISAVNATLPPGRSPTRQYSRPGSAPTISRYSSTIMGFLRIGRTTLASSYPQRNRCRRHESGAPRFTQPGPVVSGNPASLGESIQTSPSRPICGGRDRSGDGSGNQLTPYRDHDVVGAAPADQGTRSAAARAPRRRRPGLGHEVGHQPELLTTPARPALAKPATSSSSRRAARRRGPAARASSGTASRDCAGCGPRR